MTRTGQKAVREKFLSVEPPWTSDIIVSDDHQAAFERYLRTTCVKPLLLLGDARIVLRTLPDSCIDFAMTSPPYWGKREYENGGIGLERDYRDFVHHLADIFLELKRVLKPTGFLS